MADSWCFIGCWALLVVLCVLSGGVNLMQCHCSCMRAKSTLTVLQKEKKKQKKKISSTLMGQESSENFIYTFTKRCKFVTYVYITISLVSSYRRRAGQDLEMNEVWGTEFWLQRGFERCYGYKQVIKRDDKTMETSYLASFIVCLHFHSSKITWGKKHKVSVNMTASRV